MLFGLDQSPWSGISHIEVMSLDVCDKVLIDWINGEVGVALGILAVVHGDEAEIVASS